jgi:hypothetical protein
VGVPTANLTGSQLCNGGVPGGWKINPLTWPTTRLKQFAELFQKFRFRKIDFIFEASQNDFTSGSLGHYVDFDPNAAYISQNTTFQALKQASAHQGWTEMKVKQDSTCHWEPKDPEAAYWIAPDDQSTRSYQQGAYFMFIQDPWATGGSASLPQTIGRLYIRYACEFWEDAISELTSNGIAPTQGSNSGLYTAPGLGYAPPRSSVQPADPLGNVIGAVQMSYANATIGPNIGGLNSPLIFTLNTGSGVTMLQAEDLDPQISYMLTICNFYEGTGFAQGASKVTTVTSSLGVAVTMVTQSYIVGSTTYVEVLQLQCTSSAAGNLAISFDYASGGLTGGTITGVVSSFAYFNALVGINALTCMYNELVKRIPRERVIDLWVPKNSCRKLHCKICSDAGIFHMLKQRGETPREELADLERKLAEMYARFLDKECESSEEESSSEEEEERERKKKKKEKKGKEKVKNHRSLDSDELLLMNRAALAPTLVIQPKEGGRT